MKKKKETAISPDKKELKKELKKKSSALEKLKRELKIEAALEEVRARAMAMKKSEELKDVVTVVNERLRELGVSMKDRSASMIIFEEGSKDLIQWVASHEHESSSYFRTPYFDHPIFNDLLEAKEKGADFFYKTYAPEVKNSYFRYFFEHSDYRLLPDSTKKWILETEHYALSIAYTKNSALALVNLSGKPLSENDNDILKRFSRVFEQSYTRFLDLQKAEAQAREAQIELSLERVRAKTMAMHNSQDVANTVAAMFDELVKWGIDKTTRCGVAIIGKKDDMELWTASSKDNGQIGLDIGRVGLSIHPLMKGFHEAWKNKKTDYTYKLTGTSLKDYFSALNASAEYPVQFDLQTMPSKLAHSSFFFPEGALYAFSPEALTTEASKIFKRFAGVFGQTYRRFLDLQKAEEQVREAQIEAALERVRSRSMGMQKSNELKEVIQVVYDQFIHLNIHVEHTGFIMDYKERDDMHIWLADKHAVPSEITIPYFDSPHWNSFNEAKKKGIDFFANLLNFEEKNKFYHDLFQLILGVPDETQSYYLSCPALAGSTVLLDNVGLYIENFSGTPYTDEENNTLMRFGKVFQQTYTRFNDLKNAEAQTKEATLEAALEKVRGKAMAMQNSNDLSSTVSMVFTELRKLGINPIRSGVGLLNKESRKAQLYSATSSADGDSLALIGWVVLSWHPVLENIYEAWLKNEDYFPELIGEQLKSYYENLMSGLSLPSIPDWQSGQKQYGHFFSFSVGCLYAWSETPYNDIEIKILKRFASIIDLTFRRYLELQKSEANAREAVKQATLDRVRADIASMRTTTDLEKITPLIWNELTVLGIPFIRCGVFIMDEDQQQVQTFLYMEGKAIASFTSTFSNSKLITEALPYWRRKEIYKAHWDEAAFLEQAKSLVEQGAITTGEKYLTEHRPTDLYLHFLPFLQGMLYVGDSAPLSEEHLQLVQALADAFSTAYARYEDFNKLETAKQQVDKTLVDLKQTQTQLIQSEKMASLGELTAGIAHEIQNPLNFVNNFSEVSNELIEELQEERNKAQGTRDEQMENEILNDIKQNLEKINHHGKRADAIVKGMLQHSRSSTSQKEPTDINALADEYLRLSYHGLRAKDNSFNSTLKTDFDNTIGKINIIPQDIGRVLLNLYNNAFYAVNEKQNAERLKQNTEYHPTVSVQTKKTTDKVILTVMDNGNGIPQKVIDKIFQPFFTTKPTGQGTGLGLSLSYDIVKAHGGEIKVNTKEGEFTKFMIQLPIST